MRLNKDKVRELYKKGYKYNEIARILNAKPETVRKCIQRSFNNLNDVHNKNNLVLKLAQKDINRALKYEANRFMGDKTIVLSNPSVYSQNSKGDLVLNKDMYSYAGDMPKCLKNEELRVYEKTFIEVKGE